MWRKGKDGCMLKLQAGLCRLSSLGSSRNWRPTLPSTHQHSPCADGVQDATAVLRYDHAALQAGLRQCYQVVRLSVCQEAVQQQRAGPPADHLHPKSRRAATRVELAPSADHTHSRAHKAG